MIEELILQYPINYGTSYGQGWGIGLAVGMEGATEMPQYPPAVEFGIPQDSEAYKVMLRGYEDGFTDGLKYGQEKREHDDSGAHSQGRAAASDD